jgi:hypothetical protein
MTRSQLVIDKAIDRVRKLLALAKGTSEHEAALAAENATKLIEQFQLTEAMIRVDDTEAEPEVIEQAARLEPDLPEYSSRGMNGRKRIAWKETIASATASDLGIHMYWKNHVDICGFGRESAIQTWRYTFMYLCRAVDQLADDAWFREGDHEQSIRAWKNAFRVGCAQRLSTRIWQARQKRESDQRMSKYHAARERAAEVREQPEAAVHDEPESKESLALAIVKKDQEQVDAEYKAYSKGWGRSQSRIGSTSSRDGYSAGKAAGDRVSLGGKRAGLPSGQRRIGRDS